MVREIPPYLALIRRFLDGALAAKAFVGNYIDQWRRDTQAESETTFINRRTQRQQSLDQPALSAIDVLHCAANCFTTDFDLLCDVRHAGAWLDEDELRRHASEARVILEEWESRQE